MQLGAHIQTAILEVILGSSQTGTRWTGGKIGRRRDIAESERAEARDCSRDCREPDFLKKMMPWVLTDTFVRREGRIFGWSASR